MDALNSTDPVIGRRKRKLAASAVAVPGSSKPHSTVPASPDEKKPAPVSLSMIASIYSKSSLTSVIVVNAHDIVINL